jgi:cell division protein FtsI/penicillin-binding protein 2
MTPGGDVHLTIDPSIQKEVEIIADLGNGRMQVKDVKANRIFAVNTDKLN